MSVSSQTDAPPRDDRRLDARLLVAAPSPPDAMPGTVTRGALLVKRARAAVAEAAAIETRVDAERQRHQSSCVCRTAIPIRRHPMMTKSRPTFHIRGEFLPAPDQMPRAARNQPLPSKPEAGLRPCLASGTQLSLSRDGATPSSCASHQHVRAGARAAWGCWPRVPAPGCAADLATRAIRTRLSSAPTLRRLNAGGGTCWARSRRARDRGHLASSWRHGGAGVPLGT